MRRANNKRINKPSSSKPSNIPSNNNNNGVSGVGKYATGTYSSLTGKRQINGLTRRQAAKLEKMALSNEALRINSKPAMIKAIGTAIASNLAAPSTATSLAVTDNLISKNPVQKLIDGGANQAQKDNDEESIKDQYQIK